MEASLFSPIGTSLAKQAASSRPSAGPLSPIAETGSPRGRNILRKPMGAADPISRPSIISTASWDDVDFPGSSLALGQVQGSLRL